MKFTTAEKAVEAIKSGDRIFIQSVAAAPQGEITHMLSQTGGHADLNGDGVYDWQDYQQRNY